MPNWAVTYVTMVGDTKDINDLYQIMRGLEERPTPTVANDFGTTWLGCLVVALGEDWQEVCCRGEWMCLELADGVLTFLTETAWGPMTEVFELIRKKFPSIKYYYYCEEGGCCLYETNDREGCYYADRYLVRLLTSQREDYADAYFRTLSEALAWISAQTGRMLTSVEEAKQFDKELAARDKLTYCRIHEIQVA